MIKTLHYDIPDLIPYINWTYFFHAWGFPPRFGTISSIHGCDACRAGWLASFPEHERQRASEAMQLFKDAQRVLAILAEDFHTHVRFGLFKAQSEDEAAKVFQSSLADKAQIITRPSADDDGNGNANNEFGDLRAASESQINTATQSEVSKTDNANLNKTEKTAGMMKAEEALINSKEGGNKAIKK